jgi:hypothetical protein
MLENEFEKQVQQKMNELQFVPSAAAWEKVERQIAGKKKRRRVLLWLPLLVLLSGGAIWYYYMSQQLNRNNDDRVARAITVDADKQVAAKHDGAGIKIKNKNVLVSPTASQAPPNNVAEKISPVVLQEKPDHLPLTGRHLPENGRNRPVMAAKTAAHLKDRKRAIMPFDQSQTIVGTENAQAHKTGNSKYNDQAKERIEPITNDVTGKIALNNISKPPAPAPGITANQSPVTNDSAMVKPDASDSIKTFVEKDKIQTSPKTGTIRSRNKKIEWGINLSAGSSGISNGFPGLLVKRVDNAAFYSAPQSNGSNLNSSNFSTVPAVIRNHFAWSGGLVVRKSFAKTWRINSGLNYSTFASGIALGAKIDTAGLSGIVYRNGRSGSYTNRLHFIELPVTLEKQLGRRSRFSINGGLAFSVLAASNQLRFDQQANLYYADNSFINKTQWSMLLGLNYRLLQKNVQLETGPLLNYHLGNTFNRDAYGNGHWFFAGIRTTIFFGKRKR